MPTILPSKSIYYNDVNLIAQWGVISSRAEVPEELHRIIVAPMEAVVGQTFAIQANKLGLTVCLHRFCKIEEQIETYLNLSNKNNVFVAVGLKDLDRIELLGSVGVRNILIDIANGYIPNLCNTVKIIKKYINLDKLMVGNIMTWDGYNNLSDLHNQIYIRTGISGGSACQTSDFTGYNRGQITEIMEIYKSKIKFGTKTNGMSYIVADGGIKNGNYAAKSFGIGADFCMLGGYFARALEAETHINGDGTYWGGASHKQQERFGGIKRHSEGKVYQIPKDELRPLEELVKDLWGGLSSAISYSGYRTLSEFIGNGVFEIKENSLPPTNR